MSKGKVLYICIFAVLLMISFFMYVSSSLPTIGVESDESINANAEPYKRDYAKAISNAQAIIDEYNATATHSEKEVQRYSEAKLNKAGLLQQSDFNYDTTVARANFIASYHELFDVFNDVSIPQYGRAIAMSRMLIGIQQSCECYDWFADAVETYGDGTFAKKYATENLTITSATKWRDDRYLGVYMLPFNVSPLTEVDIAWQNGHFKALSIIHAMIKDLNFNDSFLLVWDMEYLLHSLDRIDLLESDRAKIIAEIAMKKELIETPSNIFESRYYPGLLLVGYVAALNYSLSQYLPDVYTFDAEKYLKSIDDALVIAEGSVARGDSDIITQESIRAFLKLYYAYIANATGTHAERIPEMLSVFESESTARVAQGAYLFLTLPQWQDALRKFMYEYAITNKAIRGTMQSAGWTFTN